MENWWNDIDEGKIEVLGAKPVPSATFSTKNPRRIGLELNPVLPTNRLSNGVALFGLDSS